MRIGKIRGREAPCPLAQMPKDVDRGGRSALRVDRKPHESGDIQNDEARGPRGKGYGGADGPDDGVVGGRVVPCDTGQQELGATLIDHFAGDL